MDVMQHLLGSAGIKTNISNLDIEEKFETLLEANDMLLDRAVNFSKDILSMFFYA